MTMRNFAKGLTPESDVWTKLIVIKKFTRKSAHSTDMTSPVRSEGRTVDLSHVDAGIPSDSSTTLSGGKPSQFDQARASEEDENDESGKSNDEDQSDVASFEDSLPGIEEDFDPSQCLFCNRVFADTDINLTHMLKSHGLFIPQRDFLAVEIETLLGYLRLIIFGYFECLHCRTQRHSVQAVQQHMMGKGHCSFDIASEESEFRELYDFDASDDEGEDEGRDIEDLGYVDSRSGINTFNTANNGKQMLVNADESSVRLPSGKTLGSRSVHKPRSQRHRATLDPQDRAVTSPDSTALNESDATSASTLTSLSQRSSGRGALTKSERKESVFAAQLANLRSEDRKGLMHLPVFQQRALLATRQKQTEKAEKARRMIQGQVERLGNKTLMKHFRADNPGGRPNG